jgi:glucose/arabinose dehydrogenase
VASLRLACSLSLLVLVLGCKKEQRPAATSVPAKPGELLVGQAATGDYSSDAPGVRRKLTPADLATPYATKSVRNSPKVVPRANGQMPRVPEGFKVELFASGLTNPRMIRTAPNGDLFVVESEANQVRLLRSRGGSLALNRVFGSGLKQPFGIDFYPPSDPRWVYVANTDSVVRFPYKPGDEVAAGPAELVYDGVSGGGRLTGGGHWTRDIVFSRDGTKLYLSVGSRSNVSDGEAEERRARIFELTPDGKNERVFAWGIRNPVGLAIHPTTGELWTSVNERDELGDNLVPDYVTSVRDGGFYGWPWFYIGNHPDPRHEGKHPELASKVIVPDVLIQSHSASLGMTFATGAKLRPPFTDAAFAAQHGSWNRGLRTGYKVIAIPIKDGHATGEYVDFMTGFVNPDGDVWGRPVAVAQGSDGALFVTDDAGDCLWRISQL